MPTSAPRTLADQLRGWPDERIATLLEERPDLASPAPTDSAQLAARAAVRVSVVRALDLLDRLQLEVLLAVVQTAPTTTRALGDVVHADAAAIAAAVDRLTDLALVWGTADALRPLSLVGELVGLPPGPDPAKVPALLAEVDDQARTMLAHLDDTDAVGTVAEVRTPNRVADATTPVEHLLVRGLLAARDERHVVVPWSVRLHLRGGRSTRDAVDAIPAFADAERDAALVDRAAAGAAYEFTRRTEMLLEAWATHAPAGLRSGGLGVRDLRAAAELLHCDPAAAALVIETAAAAHLLAQGMNDDLDSAWLPTDAYDGWCTHTGAERWLVLARAWLANPRLVSAIGGRDGDRPINALSPGIERSWLAEEKRTLLHELLGLAPGRSLAAGTGLPSLLDRLRWRHPRRPTGRFDLAPTLLDEAASVGVLGLEAPSSFGRALIAGDDPTRTLDALLPTPVDHVLIQADLTAVAPGPLAQDFARRLGLVADVESRGGATVYRFSVTSVRRAFDSGWSAIEVKDFLRDSSRTPVPQALDYLVDDVSRRFGTLRVGVAESFLRSDDETALTELLHHASADSLRLRRIAPTVLVSDVPLQVLLPRLRELGAAPVVEAADGTVRVARPDEYRARTPRGTPVAGREQARRIARTSAVVAALRAGDRAAANRPARGPATTPADVMTLLRGAAAEEQNVLIGYVDNHGTSTERVVRPLDVGGGRLSAYDERSDEVRSFAVHRITAARLQD
ncbi:helicase-associated domain-containing protein [Marmoricola sp. RAF53]|uniref:helicase-associated domain-containing protein n=1 Tax=Marmoricola sp. RAF53 TaxID=3233059 RepID=UPI003F97E1AE